MPKKQTNHTDKTKGEEKIKALLIEKKQLSKEFYKPENRRMNGKPTAEAYEKWGKRIYEIQIDLLHLRNPNL